MANSRSAAKRVRKTRTETARNRTVRNRVKSSRRKLNAALEAGDAGAAKDALKEFSSVMDRAAKKNVVHKNSASRLKSLMGGRVSALAS